MTTLRDGTIVDESITAANYTPAEHVRSVFGHSRVIQSITIHHWGNPGQRFNDVVHYLASANARQSSAHAVIQGGRATSIVNPDDAAWHAGNPKGSATSIGLELRPEADDVDYITAAAYIAFLRTIYGELPLIPHNHWTNTACPGQWDLARLDRMARTGPATPAKTTAPKETKLSAAEVSAIKAHITEENEKTREYIGQLLVAGYGVGSTRKPGIAKEVEAIKNALAKVVK